MIISIYLPLLCAGMLRAVSPIAVRRLAPALAARLLTVAAGVLALGSVWAAGLLCIVRLCEVPGIAREGHWSAQTILAFNPVPPLIGDLAAILLAGVMLASALLSWRRRQALHRLGAVAAGCRAAGDLVVVASDTPLAVALPGRNGRIVISSGLLRTLDASGRAVLLAHERSHLAHRHDRFHTVLALAAALNPLLRGVRRDARYALERWADEDAARAIGDRREVAAILTRTALLTTAQHPRARIALAFAQDRVVDRVRALHAEHPRPARALLALAALPGALCAIAVVDATGAALRILLSAQ